MPWLTPPDLPESDDCRSLSIPASAEWLALFGGALTELTQPWNWQDSGGLTVSETIDKMQEIIDAWYAGGCDCELPGGGKIIRLGVDGQIQELIDGEWQEPTGDYELPTTPAREEETAIERRCAAAENAAAIFEDFYEQVSDAFNDGLNTALAIDVLANRAATLLGATGFGLAVASLIQIATIIFGLFYALFEFIGADLWTEEFNDKFKCVLYECSGNDGDVVHFDYQCILDKLANVTSITLDLSEVRLFGQIWYLMSWIGSQGLDAAGATTSVTEFDCEGCEQTWAELIDFRISDYGFFVDVVSGMDQGEYVAGVGFRTTYFRFDATHNYHVVNFKQAFDATLTHIEATFVYEQGECSESGDSALIVADTGYIDRFINVLVCEIPDSPACWDYTSDPGTPVTVELLNLQLISGVTGEDHDPGGSATFVTLKLCGTGVAPGIGVPTEPCDPCS